MGSAKPKVVQTPFQTNYAPQSIAQTPEAKAFLDVPVNPDPGAGRRTDLAEQDVQNRWESAMMSGVPGWIRQANEAKELRDVQSQGVAEEQQANYAAQRTELERRRSLLPQIMQTGGYTSQAFQQPSLLQSFVGGAVGIGGAYLGRPRH